MKKNELIPIGPVIDRTPKEEILNVKITGTYRPVIIIDDNMINLIKFNKKYYADIISGIKTQTIRKHNKRLKDGEIVKAIFPGSENECFIQITHSGYKQFKYLNDEDAKKEGYKSLKELKSELLDIYPTLDNLTRIYYIQFKVVDDIA